MRWLERYLTEGTPRLQHFAERGGGDEGDESY
jgi:hypothetical protein